MKQGIKTLAMAVVFLSLLVTTAFAQSAPKSVAVSLSADKVVVYVGETVNLSAVSLKHGSGYSDSWTGAAKTGTVLNADGYYVSTATFSSATPGTFTVSYGVSMLAGKSHVGWTGSSSITIEVKEIEKAKSGPQCSATGQENSNSNGKCNPENESTNPGQSKKSGNDD